VRRRLLLSTLGVALVAILALGLPLLLVTARLIADAARNDLLRQAQSVQAYVEDRLTDGQLQARRLAHLVPPTQQVVVRLPGGKTLKAGPAPGHGPLVQSVSIRDGGRVTVLRPIRELHSDELRAGLVVAVLALLSAAVAAAVAMFSARRLSGPLLAVADRAAQLGSGDFRVSPERHGIPELDRVSDVLDRSATEIADLVRRERDLASDVSHQLRTRLTALQMRLEEIALSDDQTVRDEANAALEQAERLSGVVDELLAQARHARAAGAHSVDVSSEIATITEEYVPAVERAGRHLQLDLTPSVAAIATPGRLHQAVGVLVDNAVQHGAGVIRVATRATLNNVVVEVSDQGAGVDADLVPRLFERGVSGAGSTGVGLALARALVEADGGRLELRQASPPLFAVFLTRADVVQPGRNGASDHTP
jgi:signal transduction histidine kinase